MVKSFTIGMKEANQAILKIKEKDKLVNVMIFLHCAYVFAYLPLGITYVSGGTINFLWIRSIIITGFILSILTLTTIIIYFKHNDLSGVIDRFEPKKGENDQKNA